LSLTRHAPDTSSLTIPKINIIMFYKKRITICYATYIPKDSKNVVIRKWKNKLQTENYLLELVIIV